MATDTYPSRPPVLIRLDGARSAFTTPYYLAEPTGGPAFPTEADGFRAFPRQEEAEAYVREHGREPIDDTPRADEPEPEGWEPGRLFRATLRTATTKAEAQRLAREAYEDATAPRKTCRDPEHEGDRELPATLRHFSRQGKRVRADGTPILRSRCRVCWARTQAQAYLARKARRAGSAAAA